MDAQRLRQKILDLAIRGKLVEQNPNDEPASALLERIHAEKVAMVERGELKPKDVKNDSIIYVGDDNLHYEKVGSAEPVCIEDEIPFELPSGWAWSRLSCHYLLFNGSSKRLGKTGNPTAVLRLADLTDAAIDTSSMRFVNLTDDEIAKYSLADGDLIFVRVNGSREKVGRCYAFESQGVQICVCDHLIKGRSVTDLLSEYVSTAVQCGYSRALIDSGIVCASGQNTISQGVIGGLLLPVPPLEEQRRIVAALDERLGLVDRIEREEAELAELASKARAKVLDLAIRGKLVEQDPDDEPASALLERVRAEKLAMVERGELPASVVKADKIIYRGDDNSYYERGDKDDGGTIEDAFELPGSWSWARLGSISNYGESEIASPEEIDDSSWVLDLEDIEKDTGRLAEFVKKEQRPFSSSKRVFAEGQLLYSKLRPYLNKVLVAPKQGFCTAEILPIRLYGGVLPAYIRICMMSPYFLSYANQLSYGVKMPRLGTKDGRRALIPLPPLAEQGRIVANVDEVVDNLEKLLTR